jgi:hypothetical protein
VLFHEAAAMYLNESFTHPKRFVDFRMRFSGP